MLITAKPLHQYCNGEAVVFGWGKKNQPKMPMDQLSLGSWKSETVYSLLLFVLYFLQWLWQTSISCLKGLRDVLDRIQSFLFFYPTSSSESHMAILKAYIFRFYNLVECNQLYFTEDTSHPFHSSPILCSQPEPDHTQSFFKNEQK